MFDITKTYKTGDGCRVKIGFVEGEFVHGWVFSEQGPNDMPLNGRTWVNWLPACWDSETWFNISKVPGAEATDKDFAFRLQESKATKQISHTFLVRTDGTCGDHLREGDEEFATLTVNLEVEEGSDRVIVIKDNPTGERNLSLNAIEFKALQALGVYGTQNFLECFYNHLGKVYLQPYESGLRTLFEKAKKELPK